MPAPADSSMQVSLSDVRPSAANHVVAGFAVLAIITGTGMYASATVSSGWTLAGATAIALGATVLAARLVSVTRRLQAVTDRFSALTQADILGVGAWSADGSLIDANDAFLGMIGESRQGVAAGLIRSPGITTDGASIDPQTGRDRFVERKIIGADGIRRSLAWGTSELPAGQTLTFALDVTDRVAAEEALRTAREVLETRVRDLEGRDAATRSDGGETIPAERSEGRTVVSLAEKLAAANAELEAFSYSVAHDLRAPLRTIDGFSRELSTTFAGQLDPKAQHYLDRIRAGTQRMGSLIDALLELSRVARVDVRRHTNDVTALAHVVADEQKDRYAPHAEVVIADGLTADADPRLLRIILENLLGNALKFSAKIAAPRVELFELAGRDAAIFCLRDNGAGFDVKYADKLFTPFQRLHSTSHFEGTGIGLALVHRAVTRHGGTVRAESIPGRGTSIFFTLQPAGSPRREENYP